MEAGYAESDIAQGGGDAGSRGEEEDGEGKSFDE